MPTFRAVTLDRDADGSTRAALSDLYVSELMPGGVTVRVAFSSLNYKDGLAVTGRAPVVRRWPMIAGIDFAGHVEGSDDPHWRVGQPVLATGGGLGETHLGGWAELARVPAHFLTALPPDLDPAEAMALGTAGLTAMLCLMALDSDGAAPERGPVLVTGAAGGVGSLAVSLLAGQGFHVVAATGRPGEADYLRKLGAAEVIDRAELAGEARPLGKERWTAAVDAVGGATLVNLLSMTAYGGAVAACGNVGGMALKAASAAPFILRGLTLYGIDSVRASRSRREEAWHRLADEVDRQALARMTQVIGLEEAVAAAHAIVAGQVRGRTAIRIKSGGWSWSPG